MFIKDYKSIGDGKMKKTLIVLLLCLVLLGCDQNILHRKYTVSYTQEEIENGLPDYYTVEVKVSNTTEGYGINLEDVTYLRYVHTPEGFAQEFSTDGTFTGDFDEVNLCSGSSCVRYAPVHDYTQGPDYTYWDTYASYEMTELGEITYAQYDLIAINFYSVVDYSIEFDSEDDYVATETYAGRAAIELPIIDPDDNNNMESFTIYIDEEYHFTLYSNYEMDAAGFYQLTEFEITSFSATGSLPDITNGS